MTRIMAKESLIQRYDSQESAVAVSLMANPTRMFQEEPDHLGAGVWPARVGVAAFGAAA
jgi:hypothetical protein